MNWRPTVLIIVSFVVVILLGTLALRHAGFEPTYAHYGARTVPALFTSASAVCVTGLSVLDLQTEVTAAGQLIILILIQIGGLGLLTLSNWFYLSVRGRAGLGVVSITNESVGGLKQIPAATVLKGTILFTLLCEGAGVLLLFARFAFDFPLPTALWNALFHSVSAFCNAGFSTFSANLAGYADDPLVNFTVMGLIVSGGLGFIVATDIYDWLRTRSRARRRLLYHTRVVLLTTAGLIVGGMLILLLFEWDHLFREDPVPLKLMKALFLSITPRTAGFNTVDTGALSNLSLLFVMLLMFVGASPASTGGGVKTSSFAVVVALIRSQLRNRPRAELLDRSIPSPVVSKALSVIVLYLVFVMLALFLLQASDPEIGYREPFLATVFEIVSAQSTVGLSTGITAQFSPAGLVILCFSMFVGRIGPLMLVSALVGDRKPLAYTLPEEETLIG